MSRPGLPIAAATVLAAAAFLTSCASEEAATATTSANAAPATSAWQAEHVIPGAIVVDFKDGTSKEDIDTWEKTWGVNLEFNSIEGPRSGVSIAVGVNDVDAVLRQIAGHGAVEAAEPLTKVQASFVPNDPDYAKQWNMKLIDAEGAWDRTRGKGVIVAVLDTGIAYEDHEDFIQVPDLKGAKIAKGYDFVNDDDGAHDDHGHGTHVAGTIAQVTHNKEGVTGVAFEATLMPVKVLDTFGFGNASDIADAIRWAADNGAKVINMSLGGGAPSKVMENAVKYAREKGVTVICAAGNTGMGRVEYPAAYEGSVAVSAVGPDSKLAPYSSWGKDLDIAAPGGNKALGESSGILQNTLARGNYRRAVYEYYNGTSMAAPHVAGVAALLYAAGARTPDEVERALYAGAKKVDGQAERDDKYGHGILNAKGALDAFGGGGINWRPLLTALGLLAVVLLTLGRRERPGYLNILFTPAFLAPLVLATVGFFVVRWFGGSAAAGGNELLQVAELPIPDWERILFGRGKLANPLFYSALIPFIASIIAIKAKSFRPLIGGLALGFAGFLAYSAWANAPALAWMPFTFLATPWLVVNALLCLVITRAMLKKEVAA